MSSAGGFHIDTPAGHFIRYTCRISSSAIWLGYNFSDLVETTIKGDNSAKNTGVVLVCTKLKRCF